MTILQRLRLIMKEHSEKNIINLLNEIETRLPVADLHN